MVAGGPEDVVESTVVAKAEMDGWVVRKVAWVGRRKAMDRLFAKAGRLLFIEFKAPGKDATVTQAREHRIFREQGVEVHVVDNIRDGLRILGIA